MKNGDAGASGWYHSLLRLGSSPKVRRVRNSPPEGFIGATVTPVVMLNRNWPLELLLKFKPYSPKYLPTTGGVTVTFRPVSPCFSTTS